MCGGGKKTNTVLVLSNRVRHGLHITIGLGDGRELLLVMPITNVKLKNKSTYYEQK